MDHRILRVRLCLVLAAALVAAWLLNGYSTWDWKLILLLALTAVIAANPMESRGLQISADGTAIALAVGLLGPGPGAVVAVTATTFDALRRKPGWTDTLWNLATFAWFPLAAGVGAVEVSRHLPGHQGLILGVAIGFGVATVASFLSMAIATRVFEGVPVWVQVRDQLVPILSSESASLALTCGTAVVYSEIGFAAFSILAVVLLLFQWQTLKNLELRDTVEKLETSNLRQIVQTIRLLSMKDDATARHSAAVALYVRSTTARMDMTNVEAERYNTAALLHDIGKMAVPETILNAARRLTDEEFRKIRTHPYQGAKIISAIEGYEDVAAIVLAHHESFDGRGYPRRLSGEDIPLGARLIAIADTYDVMTARTVYREPRPHDEAVAELRDCAGAQFDPVLVETFIEMLEETGIRFGHAGREDFENELNRLVERRRERLPGQRDESSTDPATARPDTSEPPPAERAAGAHAA